MEGKAINAPHFTHFWRMLIAGTLLFLLILLFFIFAFELNSYTILVVPLKYSPSLSILFFCALSFNLKRYQNSFHPLCFTAINAFISACYADEMNSSMRNSEKRLFDNSKSFNQKDKSVTYRLHDDLLRFYRKGTRPVMHPNKLITVSMSVFLYQIIKLVSFYAYLA